MLMQTNKAAVQRNAMLLAGNWKEKAGATEMSEGGPCVAQCPHFVFQIYCEKQPGRNLTIGNYCRV